MAALVIKSTRRIERVFRYVNEDDKYYVKILIVLGDVVLKKDVVVCINKLTISKDTFLKAINFPEN